MKNIFFYFYIFLITRSICKRKIMRGGEKTQNDIYIYLEVYLEYSPDFRESRAFARLSKGWGVKRYLPDSECVFHSNEKNRFAAYLERKWR